MVAVNIKNTFSFYNSIIRMYGLLKPAEGEYAAQVYVICSKIKRKINELSYSDTTKSNLINKIDKWNNIRCFLFEEKYLNNDNEKLWKKINSVELRQAINDVSNIKISVIKNKNVL
jgi:hypothetical protein